MSRLGTGTSVNASKGLSPLLLGCMALVAGNVKNGDCGISLDRDSVSSEFLPANKAVAVLGKNIWGLGPHHLGGNKG